MSETKPTTREITASHIRQEVRDRISKGLDTGPKWREKIAKKYKCVPLTVEKHSRAVRLQEYKKPLDTISDRSSSKSGKRLDLVETIQDSAEKIAAQIAYRLKNSKKKEGEGSLAGLLTALGLAVDKLTLLRKSEDSEIWRKVLRADDVKTLDQMIYTVRERIAALQGAAIGTDGSIGSIG